MVKKLLVTLLGTLCVMCCFSQESLGNVAGFDSRIPPEPNARIPEIVGDAEVCSGGGFALFGLDTVPEYSRIQWYVDGELQLHENASTFNYRTSFNRNTTNEIGCVVMMLRQAHEEFNYDYWTYDTVQLRNFLVTNVWCCSDPKGKTVSRRTVWKEDFGTFTSEDTYTRWDYSDPSSVKKNVFHTDSAWSYCMDSVVPGFVCAPNPSYENTYSVAAHVPNREELLPIESSGYFLDYTDGSEFGGMLFVHMNVQSDTVVYSTVINGLCGDDFTSYSARFYARALTGLGTAPKLFFRFVDESTGEVLEPTEFDSWRISDEGLWSYFWNQFDFTGTSLRLEIYTTRDYLREMEDVILTLDDIQLWACAPHSPELEVKRMSDMVVGGAAESGAEFEPSVGAAGSDDPIKFMTDGVNGSLWTVENQRSVIQYTLTPDDYSSWKTVAEASDYESVLAEHGKVFFRYVIGPAEMIASSVINPNEVCAPFSISNVVEYSEEKTKPKVEKPVVDDIVVCEGGIQYLSASFGLAHPDFYYKWYLAELDSTMTGERVKVINKMRPEDDLVSVYDYYVSMCDRETGEESEKALQQVLVFSAPKSIPERLSLCGQDVDITQALSPYSTDGYVYSLTFFDQERGGNIVDQDDLTEGGIYVVQNVKPLRHIETCRSDRRYLELDLSCSKPDVNVTENEENKCAEVQFSPVDGASAYHLRVFDGDWSLINSVSFTSEGEKSDLLRYSSQFPLIHYVFDVVDADKSLAYRTVGTYKNNNSDVSGGKDYPDNGSYVYVWGGRLYVFGATDGEVMVTNMLGQVVSVGRVEKGETCSFRLSKGVYFVSVNGDVTKVLVD